MGKYSVPRRPMETDKFYRYVSLKSFDRFKDGIEAKRSRDLIAMIGLRKRLTELEAEMDVVTKWIGSSVIPQERSEEE